MMSRILGSPITRQVWFAASTIYAVAGGIALAHGINTLDFAITMEIGLGKLLGGLLLVLMPVLHLATGIALFLAAWTIAEGLPASSAPRMKRLFYTTMAFPITVMGYLHAQSAVLHEILDLRLPDEAVLSLFASFPGPTIATYGLLAHLLAWIVLDTLFVAAMARAKRKMRGSA